MKTVTLAHVPAGAAALLAACCCSGVALAHCGAGDVCETRCHHGACTEESGGARLAQRVQSAEVTQAVKELIIPKVPQMNLPLGNAPRTEPAARRPPNLPAAAGQAPTQIPPAHDPLPLPAPLTPSAIARVAAPQVFTGIISVTRDIEHEHALEALARKDPRLAESTWLSGRRTVKLGEAYQQLERIDKRTRAYIETIDPQGPYSDLHESLSRAARTLQVFGSGEQPKENE